MLIEIYDETSQYSNNVRLTNKIDELHINFVNIELPKGKMRLNYAKIFTHIICTVNNIKWILRVESSTNLAGELWEYQYTVDYVKDFFAKQTIADKGFKVLRSNNGSYRNPFLYDTEWQINGEVQYTNEKGNNILDDTSTGISVNYGIMLVLSSADNRTFTNCDIFQEVYLFNPPDYYSFIKDIVQKTWFVNSFSGEKSRETALFESINAIYVTPFKDWDGISYVYDNETQRTCDLTFFGDVSGDSVFHLDVSAKRVVCDYIEYSGDMFIGTRHKYKQPIYKKIDTGLTLSNIDFRRKYHRSYNLYVPFAGNIELKIDGICPAYKSNIKIEAVYYLDILTGDITVKINDCESMIIQGHLCDVPLTTGNESKTTSLMGAFVSTVASVGAAILTKGGSAAISAAGVAGGAGMLKAGLTDNQSTQIASATNTKGMHIPYFILETQFTPTAQDINVHALQQGFLCNKYITSELAKGYHYILECSNALIQGAKWYTDGVKQELNGKRIYVN